MKKIMFVCHGNICRSPMAEFILKKMLTEKGIAENFVVASSATSTEEIYGDRGNPVYPPAKRELARQGITDTDGKFATQITRADADNYDLLICMDSANLRNIRIDGVMGMASNTDDEERVRADFAEIARLFVYFKLHYFPTSAHFKHISMGMTHDYPIAIKEGATLVRVGSGIFGERMYQNRYK